MKAPINAAAPPAIHAPIISSRVDVQEATIAGVTKIPEPTIPPITTMVASKKPMRRASRSSGTRTLYHARAGLAGPRSELQPRHGGYRHIPVDRQRVRRVGTIHFISAGEPVAHGRTARLLRGGPFPPPARPGAEEGRRSTAGGRKSPQSGRSWARAPEA